MNQRQVGFLADGGERAHARALAAQASPDDLGVSAPRSHCGVSRGVDDRAEGAPAEASRHCSGLARVQAVAVDGQEGHVLLGQLANQLGAETDRPRQ